MFLVSYVHLLPNIIDSLTNFNQEKVISKIYPNKFK